MYISTCTVYHRGKKGNPVHMYKTIYPQLFGRIAFTYMYGIKIEKDKVRQDNTTQITMIAFSIRTFAIYFMTTLFLGQSRGLVKGWRHELTRYMYTCTCTACACVHVHVCSQG